MKERALVIVVGVDFSESGDLALREALSLAAHYEGAEVHVVHVPTNSELNVVGQGQLIERQNAAIELLANRLWERVDAIGDPVAEGLRHTRISVHIRFGDPAEVIHQVAVDYNGDLAMVGTQGRRGLERLVLGSVAEKLLRIAHLPVSIVRAKNFAGLPRSDRVEPASREPSLRSPEPRQVHVYRPSSSWTRTPFGTTGSSSVAP